MFKLNFRILLQFALVFIALAFVPTLYFASELSKAEEEARQQVDRLTQAKLEYARLELKSHSTKILKSVKTLSSNSIFRRAILEPTPINTSALQDFWLLVARTQGYFSQLRYLDNDGQEIVRITHNQRTSAVTSPKLLQNKVHRDYFSFARQLPTNTIGTFGIDLKKENNEIVKPLTPSLRIIVPVDINAKRHGYFIANLDFKFLYLRLTYDKFNNELPDVYNTQGYYVMSKNMTNIMGHIAKENSQYKLSKLYPNLWRDIQLNQHGTIFEQGKWLSYVKTALNTLDRPLHFILVAEVSQHDADQLYLSRKDELAIKAISVYIIILLITFSFIVWNYNHTKNSMDSQIARAAMNGMSAMLITDRQNRIIKTNEEFTRVSGYTFEEVKGKQPSFFAANKHEQEFYINMWKILEKDGLWEGEVVNKRRDGSHITEILRIQTVTDKNGVIQFYVASFVDISHRKELENRLREMSEKDAMTGLWNRRKFDQEMAAQCLRTKRYHDAEPTCFAIVDIDHFKRVNDQLGHDEGDRIIKSVGVVLSAHLRETDFIARIGGEEFAIIMPHTRLQEAEIVTNRLRTSVSLEHSEKITVSVGVTDMDGSIENTYKRADVALYESKSLGRNSVSILASDEMDTVA
ncbi:sensor domain-containing diguanylate cyclase [Vibrio sp. Isolate25]|uniref:GGDEF domain-containing protein n=1 Tax=Vibrio sp. Isolate25 TaxID=2908535 RepID=UPI001EFE5E73|nr:sensor domain-containing diguanylate cyclase [Vibrio sp. Isolate25]MCG9595756.1 sensor domain-containing diguanylate cyclase [Vibrio sp. Isolate25]